MSNFVQKSNLSTKLYPQGERWRIYPPTISRAEPAGRLGGGGILCLDYSMYVPTAILNQFIGRYLQFDCVGVSKSENHHEWIRAADLIQTFACWGNFYSVSFLEIKSGGEILWDFPDFLRFLYICVMMMYSHFVSFLEIKSGGEISWDFPDFLRFLAAMGIWDAEEASSQTFLPSITRPDPRRSHWIPNYSHISISSSLSMLTIIIINPTPGILLYSDLIQWRVVLCKTVRSTQRPKTLHGGLT